MVAGCLMAQTIETPGSAGVEAPGIPEPSTYLMLVTGGAGLGYLYYRKRRRGQK
jgi:hypothetical protein